MSRSYRLGIGLLGKGSTNHLHKADIVQAFLAHGVSVIFLVREDYRNLLTPLEGADYRTIRFKEPSRLERSLTNCLADIRWLYPSRDPGRLVNEPPAETQTFGTRCVRRLYRVLAWSRTIMRLLLTLEERLVSPARVDGVVPGDIDQLLLLGIGTVNSELEGLMTCWARHHRLPTIHFIGNYDNLSSKGYRGVSVERLLVWGESMILDASDLHGISRDRITAIGSVRYNRVMSSPAPTRSEFLNSIGLRPDLPTILFAGFVFEFHYFEIMAVLQLLRQQGRDCQLILRVYPNKYLLNSVYMEPMKTLAASLPGVYVSIGDPHYRTGQRDREVLQIEEHELMNSLRHCDLVVNQYSTISVESSMFDKPTINMWYFQPANRAMRSAPEVVDFPRLFHNRRMDSYGAVPRAQSREQLMDLIKEAFDQPSLRSAQRRRVVEREIGVLDGKANQRLVEACVTEWTEKGSGRR